MENSTAQLTQNLKDRTNNLLMCHNLTDITNDLRIMFGDYVSSEDFNIQTNEEKGATSRRFLDLMEYLSKLDQD